MSPLSWRWPLRLQSLLLEDLEAGQLPDSVDRGDVERGLVLHGENSPFSGDRPSRGACPYRLSASRAAREASRAACPSPLRERGASGPRRASRARPHCCPQHPLRIRRRHFRGRAFRPRGSHPVAPGAQEARSSRARGPRGRRACRLRPRANPGQRVCRQRTAGKVHPSRARKRPGLRSAWTCLETSFRCLRGIAPAIPRASPPTRSTITTS
jgi:hypothetical protein